MTIEKKVQVGASVLETLTTGMYVDPFDALREYLQNAADSVRAAISQKILPGIESGRIEISIDPKLRTIRIRDNGTGISAQDVLDKLLDVGVSEKKFETSAGFRGIGRLAGLAYCSKLIFSTRGHGEDLISSLCFDAVQLRANLIPSRSRDQTIQDVLLNSCNPDVQKASKKSSQFDHFGDRFFEVRLEGVSEGAEQFLDWKLVERYLRQTAPVALNPGQFAFAKKIERAAELAKATIPEIVTTLVYLGDARIDRRIFRPYDKITYETSTGVPVKIKEIKFISDQTNNAYWGWYGVSDTPGSVADDAVAGIRLRKCNIAIGPASERMDDVFAKSAPTNNRFNKYLVGEIHIFHPEVIPNARRDGFEPTSAWLEIEKQLIEFAKERIKEIRANSTVRNASVDKVLKGIKPLIDEAQKRAVVGVVDKGEREEFARRIEKQKAKLLEAEQGDRVASDRDRLKEALDRLNDAATVIAEAPFRTSKLKTSLDRNQRSIIEDILSMLKKALDSKTYAHAEEVIMRKYGVESKKPELARR